MKRMKRILSLFLALVMCLSMVNLTVFAVEETAEEDYTCGLEEHTHTDECYAPVVDPDKCDLEESATPTLARATPPRPRRWRRRP